MGELIILLGASPKRAGIRSRWPLQAAPCSLGVLLHRVPVTTAPAVRGLQMQEYGPPGWPGGSRCQNKARSEADIPTRRSLPAPWLSSQIPAEHRTVSPCQLPPLKDEDKIKRQGSCPEIFFLPSFPRAGENPASLCCGGFQQFHLGFYSKRAKTPWFPYEALLKHLEKFPACNFSLCLYCHRK